MKGRVRPGKGGKKGPGGQIRSGLGNTQANPTNIVGGGMGGMALLGGPTPAPAGAAKPAGAKKLRRGGGGKAK